MSLGSLSGLSCLNYRFGNSSEVRREGGIFGEKTAADIQVFSLGLSRKAVGILVDMAPRPAKILA